MSKKKESHKNIVSIIRGTYRDIDINRLLIPLGGMSNFVDKGDNVLLKVNLLSASSPDSAVITHPTLVRAVAKAVLDVGGNPVIGDSPSREFTKRRLDKVYECAGLKTIAAELGIELNYDTSSTTVIVPNGKKLKSAPIARFILNADKVIALPKLKTHSLMILTLATKIMFGTIPGLTKARYHSMYFTKKVFSNMLLDVLQVAKPHLFIMDGITAMQGDGPFSGDPVELNVLLASEDAVAMDLSVCEMLNIEPVGVPVLKSAKLRGLWPSKISYPLLSPKDVYYPVFRLPATAGYLLTGSKPPRKWPVISPNCTGCGDCQMICPKSAVNIVNNKATVNYDLCIRCYCCHEVCPDKAIYLKSLK